MTNKIIIKKMHQYLFGYITYPENEDIYRLIEETDNQEKENEENFNIEVYPKIPIENISVELYNFFNELNRLIYSEKKITSIQVLVSEDYYSLKPGSYNLKFPYLLSTGPFGENQKGKLIEVNCYMIFLVYTEMRWIENFHAVGLSESLKQAGEIRFLAKRYWGDKEISNETIKTSPNILTNIAGLNVNTMLFMDAFGISKEKL